MPHLPKVDKRLIQAFLSVVLLRDVVPHTRACPLGAEHRPKVDAGQDINNPQFLFIIYEEARFLDHLLFVVNYADFAAGQCRGRDGVRCDSHGLPYAKQLTEHQRVAAVAEVIQLEPFPYQFDALLDWCVNYVTPRQHLLPGSQDPEHATPAYLRRSSAPPTLVRPALRLGPATVAHNTRHRCWVSSLIPAQPRSAGGATSRGPSRVVASARPTSSMALNAQVTTLAKVYCYVSNGCQPELVEVDANQREAMTYVNLHHPDILKAFGLKPRARNLTERLQVYDIYRDKWYHPAAVSLWLRINTNEVLIVKASTITRTPDLEHYALKAFAKPPRASVDSLCGFLALSRTPADRRLPFAPVPPLTVMLADVPENVGSDGVSMSCCPITRPATSASTQRSSVAEPPAPSGSRPPVPEWSQGAKRHKRNDGSAGVLQGDVIELTSDEEDTPCVSNTPSQPWSSASGASLPSAQRPRKREVRHHVPTTVQLAPSRARNPCRNHEVIIISDEDEPMVGSSARNTGVAAPKLPNAPRAKPMLGSSTRGTGSAATNLANAPEVIVIDDDDTEETSAIRCPQSSSAAQTSSRSTTRGSAPELTCSSFTVNRRRRDKGKGRMRAAQENEDDSGADSDRTLC